VVVPVAVALFPAFGVDYKLSEGEKYMFIAYIEVYKSESFQ